MTLENQAHLCIALQVMLGIGKQVRPRLVESGAVADRDHHIVQPPPLTHVIVDLVGRHDRRPAALCHRGSAFEHPRVLGAKVVMQLAENVVLAQLLLEPAEARLIVSGAEVEEVATVLGDGGEGCARLTLGLIGVGKAEQAAEVGVAAQVAGDHHHVLAVDLERGADERLHPDLATGLEKPDSAIDASAVGDRERGHAQVGCAECQLGGMGAAVEERKVGVAVQLDVRVHVRAATRRSLATNLGDCHLFRGGIRLLRPRRKRARDLAPVARQAPEPAKRTGGVNSFSEDFCKPCSPTMSFCTPSLA